MAPANEVPSFFKGILFQESTQRLRLPKAFGEYLKGRLSSKVFLRNPYRDLWPVEMARSETGEYTFEEGWSRFFEQNKLEYKDFMIFQYDGNSVFDFKIYGNDMDEKEYTRFPEVKPDPDVVEQPPRRQLQQPRQPPRPRKQPRQQQQQQQRRPEVVQRKEMEPEWELEHEVEREPELNELKQPRQPRHPQQPRQPQQQKQRRPEAVQREKMEHEQEVEQDVEREPEPDKVEKLQQPHQRPLQQPQQQKQRRPEVVQRVEMEPEPELELELELELEQEVERELEPEVEREYEPMEVDDHEEDDDDFLFETEEQINARNKKRRKRAPPIKEADQDVVFESGEIPRPDNPYFVTQRRPGRNELYIPIDVVTAFDLKLSKTLILCDEKNRKWPAKVHVWKDGRIWLSGGWKTICKWNTVKPTDMCLCEFIPATQEHDMFLKIRVVPDAALRRPARKSS